MKRFHEFIGRAVDRGLCAEPALLAAAGLRPRYLPEAFDELDEMDFIAPYEEERRLVLAVALEQGIIQRILIGWAAPDDPGDAMRMLDGEELSQALEAKGAAIKAFLEAVTSPPPSSSAPPAR